MIRLNDTLEVPQSVTDPYGFSEPYWRASREKRLLLQYCKESQQFQFYPRPMSIATGRQTLEWREVDGRGEIYTYSVTHRGFGPFEGHEPYAVVIVRLDAGVDILSNLVHCEPADLRVGLRVKPFWKPLADGRHLLLFAPDKTQETPVCE
jgi:uncharacterized protein